MKAKLRLKRSLSGEVFAVTEAEKPIRAITSDIAVSDSLHIRPDEGEAESAVPLPGGVRRLGAILDDRPFSTGLLLGLVEGSREGLSSNRG